MFIFPAVLSTDCPTPGDVLHGTIDGSEFSIGSVITYRCDSGYHIDGHTGSVLTAVCGEDNSWDTPSPACVGK
jgi:hypothetical protein